MDDLETAVRLDAVLEAANFSTTMFSTPQNLTAGFTLLSMALVHLTRT